LIPRLRFEAILPISALVSVEIFVYSMPRMGVEKGPTKPIIIGGFVGPKPG
jgi:hypothetical protein